MIAKAQANWIGDGLNRAIDAAVQAIEGAARARIQSVRVDAIKSQVSHGSAEAIDFVARHLGYTAHTVRSATIAKYEVIARHRCGSVAVFQIDESAIVQAHRELDAIADAFDSYGCKCVGGEP